MLILVVAFAVSLVVTLITVRSAKAHAHLSHDHDLSGPQKFHATPVPRIGGFGILAGSVAGTAAVWVQDAPSGQQALLLLACGLRARPQAAARRRRLGLRVDDARSRPRRSRWCWRARRDGRGPDRHRQDGRVLAAAAAEDAAHENASMSPARHPVRALVLAPTRELADQVANNVKTYAKHTQLRTRWSSAAST
jgi:hypothetical protein